MKKKKLVALAMALVSACTLATQGVTNINALTRNQEEALDAFQNIKKDFLEGTDDELSILDILYIKRDIFDDGTTTTTTTTTTTIDITPEEPETTTVTTSSSGLTLISPPSNEETTVTTAPTTTTDNGTIISSSTPLYKGIDVSKWQGTINWQKVKDSGVDFAIIRAGLRGDAGGLSKDAYFEYNYNQCKLYGIPVGCYWYTNATTVAQVQEEVTYFMSLIDGKQFEYPICFDIESERMLSCSASTLTDITISFCDTLQENGYYVSIYSNPTWFQNYLDLSRLTQYDKWLANWTTTPKWGNEFGGLWQYKVGTCLGVTGECDLDYSYRDYSYIIQNGGYNGF